MGQANKNAGRLRDRRFVLQFPRTET